MPPKPNTDSETQEPPVATQETITVTGHARRKYQTRTTEEQREKLIDEHLNQNIPVKVICQRHSLSDSTVREIIRRFKNEKRTAYKPRGGARITKLNSNHAMHIVRLMDAEDDNNILSLDDIRENLLFSFPEDFEALVCPISCHAISRHLTEHALISLKRTRPPPPVDASTIATLSTAALTSPSLSTLQLPEHPDHEQDLNEYVATLKSMGASYLENCIFVGQTRYTAYMLPGRSRSRKGKSVNSLKKAKRAVGFVVLGAFDTNGVRLQARMEKACAQDANMMEFMNEILDQEMEPKNIIMSDAFNNAALTDLILQSKHKRIFLPSSLSYTLDPTDALFTHLPSFVNRQTLAENERLLDRVVLARDQIPNESCAAWINTCAVLLNQGQPLNQA